MNLLTLRTTIPLTNLTGFESINGQVTEIATNVGKTPQAWNGSIFSMIRTLSENVEVPIAGIILTFVMCLELIQMLIDRNNIGYTVLLCFTLFKTSSLAKSVFNAH